MPNATMPHHLAQVKEALQDGCLQTLQSVVPAIAEIIMDIRSVVKNLTDYAELDESDCDAIWNQDCVKAVGDVIGLLSSKYDPKNACWLFLESLRNTSNISAYSLLVRELCPQLPDDLCAGIVSNEALCDPSMSTDRSAPQSGVHQLPPKVPKILSQGSDDRSKGIEQMWLYLEVLVKNTALSEDCKNLVHSFFKCIGNVIAGSAANDALVQIHADNSGPIKAPSVGSVNSPDVLVDPEPDKTYGSTDLQQTQEASTGDQLPMKKADVSDFQLVLGGTTEQSTVSRDVGQQTASAATNGTNRQPAETGDSVRSWEPSAEPLPYHGQVNVDVSTRPPAQGRAIDAVRAATPGAAAGRQDDRVSSKALNPNGDVLMQASGGRGQAFNPQRNAAGSRQSKDNNAGQGSTLPGRHPMNGQQPPLVPSSCGSTVGTGTGTAVATAACTPAASVPIPKAACVTGQQHREPGDSKSLSPDVLQQPHRPQRKCLDAATNEDGCTAVATDHGLVILYYRDKGDPQYIMTTKSYRSVTWWFSGDRRWCVVAGNETDRRVELFYHDTRSPGGWYADGNMYLKDNVPWCLTVDPAGDLLYVGSARNVHHVHIGSEQQQSVVFEPGFTVAAVAVSGETLIVASKERINGSYPLEWRRKHELGTVDRKESMNQRPRSLRCDGQGRCCVLLEDGWTIVVLDADRRDAGFAQVVAAVTIGPEWSHFSLIVHNSPEKRVTLAATRSSRPELPPPTAQGWSQEKKPVFFPEQGHSREGNGTLMVADAKQAVAGRPELNGRKVAEDQHRMGTVAAPDRGQQPAPGGVRQASRGGSHTTGRGRGRGHQQGAVPRESL